MPAIRNVPFVAANRRRKGRCCYPGVGTNGWPSTRVNIVRLPAATLLRRRNTTILEILSVNWRYLPYLSSFCVLLLLCTPSLCSQAALPVIPGIIVERSVGIVSGTAPLYGGSGDCGQFASGTFSSFGAGMSVSFPTFFWPQLGVRLRSIWRSSTYQFSARPENPPWVFDASVDRAREIEREFQLESAAQTLSLGVQGTYRLGSHIAFALGPEVGYRFAGSTQQTDHILGPDDLAFPDGQTVRPMVEGGTYSPNRWALGLVGSGSVAVPIGPRLAFLLEGTVAANLLSPVVQEEWKGLSFGGSVGFLLHPPHEKKPPPHLPDIVEPSFPPSPPAPSFQLSARIEVYGLEGEHRHDTITSRFREKEYCRSVQCVPRVLFVAGSADLPDSYAQDSSAQSSLPTFDSLPSLSPFALQAKVLDLLALRLARFPEGVITLHPVGADKEIGRQRSMRIREYLRGVWGIPPEQVVIGDALPNDSTAEPYAEGKESVLIAASSPGIFAPVLSRSLDRDFDAPLIKVTTSHQADAGLRAWEVLLTSRGRTIARYSSGGSGEEGTGSLNWNMIYDDEHRENSTVTALFMVEDSAGARKSARDEAPLLMLRSRIAVAHSVDVGRMTETLLYRFPAPGTAPDAGNRRADSLGCDDILRELDRSLREGGEVWVGEESDGGGVAYGSSSPEFRSALREIAERHGAGAVRTAPQQELRKELQELLNDRSGCVDPEFFAGAACVVVLRQPLQQ